MYCYEIFKDLSVRRPAGMGMSPISYSELFAYKKLLNIDLDIWELKIILQLDEWLMEHVADEQEKKDKSK